VNADAPVLEARHLTRRVSSDGAERAIVDDFSFAFHPGRIYSILGPSGAGKSSVLRLLNRLDEPSAGEVVFEGADYRTIAPCQLRKRIGFLFQVPYLYPGTVADNLLYADNGLDSKRIEHLLNLASFNPQKSGQAAASLSVGEKQRVALARLLATDPSVILLDEPTAALDPTYTSKIESAVRKISAEQGLTVIMVSHSPEQAVRMGGEGLLIVSGRLEEYGPADRLVNQPQTEAGRRYRDRELT
jgi:putative ABC transport system ATP-binding protein